MPTTAATISQQDVARLVTEVIRRIRAEAGPLASAAPPAAPSPAPTAVAVVSLSDRVVSAEILERLPAGTRRVRLPQRPVITPSARDLARDRGIELLPAAAQPVATAGRPLVIARADCQSDVSRLAASISRAVPASQQLPAAGLASALTAIADQAGRDAARAILLTDSPAVACVAANRHPSLRAVTAADAAGIEAAAEACAANLLIVEPARFSAHSLERLAARFAAGPTQTPPAALTAAVSATAPKPAGCNCQHGH